jgi:DNA-directed RNA polymerase specialized sigma24 family protein
MLDPLPFPADFLLAQKCLEGEPLAIRQLEQNHRVNLVSYLIHAGATAEEARELADELWADCLADRAGRPPRLATYAGNSPLQTWLKAVVLNNLVQLKRRQNRVRQVPMDDGPLDDAIHADDPHAPSSSGARPSAEAPLLEIMHRAVEAAFRECDPEDFVLVQLAHTNGLLGRELARMFSCSEAKICRDLERARHKIAAATMGCVRAQDPWLELQWEDFVELCRVVSPACFGVE